MTRVFDTYPGHFDGDPLVPGAALLDWVQAEVPSLRTLDRVRFLAPVRPGEAVRLELAVDGDRVRFAVRGADGVRMRGEGMLGAIGSTS